MKTTMMKKEEVKAGDVVSFNGSFFDVVKYDGFFGKKGRLKIIERKSMFDGARDFWLDEVNKVKVIPLKKS